ncbi:MAG: hypothetical protein D6707_07110 [Bacteroidetes bacterium]|nr:MAG: hypothetical protein D6707_07110 [Bacteroidota bacterium]
MENAKNYIIRLTAVLISAVLFNKTELSAQILHKNPWQLKPVTNIRIPQNKEEKKHSTKFLLNFDNYRSQVAKQWVKFNGLRIGIEIDDVIRTGFGFYGMSEGVTVTNSDQTEENLINYRYNNFFVEAVVYENYKWELVVNSAIGKGKGNVVSTNLITQTAKTVQIPETRVFTIGAGALYKIVPWLGVGLGIGGRKLLTDDELLNKGLSSPFYAIKVKLILSEIIKAVFKPEKYKAEKEQYLKERAAKKQKK